MLSASTLASCASKPYFCQSFDGPAGKPDQGRRALVCEQSFRADLFTRWTGVELTVVIQDANQEVLAERTVRFIDQAEIDFSASWMSATQFVVEVTEGAMVDGDPPARPLATVYVSVPER
jgi:hypothetical protein